jgi:hypothetical protein
MKHFKMLFCCLMVVCLSITHQSVNAQNKRVNEECQNDADCASGKCLTVCRQTEVHQFAFNLR